MSMKLDKRFKHLEKIIKKEIREQKRYIRECKQFDDFMYAAIADAKLDVLEEVLNNLYATGDQNIPIEDLTTPYGMSWYNIDE